MPRQPVSEDAEVGVMDSLMSEGEGVNVGDGESPTGPAPSEPPAPVERNAEGEEIKQGVVQRVRAPTERTALRSEMTPAERAALEASQIAPAGPALLDEDLTEIEGLPYLTVVKDALIGLVAKQGWEAIGDQYNTTLVQAFPRLYRTIRYLHKRGIYGDRKDRGITPAQVKAQIG